MFSELSYMPEGPFCIHDDVAFNASQSYMPDGLFCIHDDVAYNANHSMMYMAIVMYPLC